MASPSRATWPAQRGNLAYLYEQGRGLPLDYVAAYAWYSSALAAGDASGANRRKQISHLLTPKQIDEATFFLTNFSSSSQQVASPPRDDSFSLLQSH
jgi:hypothetical protein